MLRLKAPAKVNLCLRVLGRRDDGYHLLSGLMQKLTLFDELTLETGGPGISLSCPDSDLPENRDNIAFRAAELFFSALSHRLPPDPGICIVLHKTIPTAAGLGGGSSDAAAVLVGLEHLFDTGCGAEVLAELALELGADVPFFVQPHPACLATGVGERLRPARGLESCRVVLVNPGFSVPTKWVYENLPLTLTEKISNLSDSHFSQEDSEPLAAAPFGCSDLYNDLEQVTMRAHPEIQEIQQQLLEQGAAGVLMSGSGPTVFGIFPGSEQAAATRCYQAMRRTYRRTFLAEPLRKEECRLSDGSCRGT